MRHVEIHAAVAALPVGREYQGFSVVEESRVAVGVSLLMLEQGLEIAPAAAYAVEA